LSVCLFVSKITQKKLLERCFTKFGGKVADEPRKNPLDFGGDPAHVTLELGYD